MFRFRSLSGGKLDTPEGRSLLYEGKAKNLYHGPNNHTLIQHFRDTITAGNGKKSAELKGKGIINSLISELLMVQLQEVGIPTHFVRRISPREQLIRRSEVLPVEVVIRNRAAGSLCKRLGLKEGERLRRPMVEFFYKNDSLGDPLISEENIHTMGWMTPVEIEEVAGMAYRINDFISGYLAAVGIRLVDMKLEFGRPLYESPDGEEMSLILIDEISPDTTRLWDVSTGRILDKDRFRKDLGEVLEGYREVASRLGVLTSVEGVDMPASALVSKPTIATATS